MQLSEGGRYKIGQQWYVCVSRIHPLLNVSQNHSWREVCQTPWGLHFGSVSTLNETPKTKSPGRFYNPKVRRLRYRIYFYTPVWGALVLWNCSFYIYLILQNKLIESMMDNSFNLPKKKKLKRLKHQGKLSRIHCAALNKSGRGNISCKFNAILLIMLV